MFGVSRTRSLLLLVLGACQGADTSGGLDAIVEIEQRRLGFEVGGRLASVEVKRGDTVIAGQLLAKLDDSMARAERPVLEAQVARAEAQLQLAMAGARNSEIRAAEAQLAAANSA